MPDLRKHLAALNADDLVFTSPEGSPLRHSNFYRRVDARIDRYPG